MNAAKIVTPFALLVVGLGLYYGTRNRLISSAVPVPSTLMFTEFLRGGPYPNGHVSTTRIVARRADGSQVDINTFRNPDGSTFQERRIRLRLADGSGERIEIRDGPQVKTTIKYSPAAFQRWVRSGLAPDRECMADYGGQVPSRAKFSQEQKAGFDATKLENGGLVQWLAPSLGCAEIWRMMSFYDAAGSLTDSSELRLDRRIGGEPDPSLFNVPPYPEVGPIEAHRRQLVFKKLTPAQIDTIMTGESVKGLAALESAWAASQRGESRP